MASPVLGRNAWNKNAAYLTWPPRFDYPIDLQAILTNNARKDYDDLVGVAHVLVPVRALVWVVAD